MEHHMGLYDEPFNSIKAGRKTVEVRLYDEKRRKINVGHTVKFTKVPDNDETLTVKVRGLKHYSTFKEMYENTPSADLDASGETIEQMVKDTYEIYSPEREKEWGTLAISIELLK